MALKTYPNGLKLSILNKKDSKLAEVLLYVTSGTQSEKNYECGISEFTSRMLLMGTTAHPSKRELSDYAKSQGIVLSSDNFSEYIIVRAITTSDNVSRAIDLINEIAFSSLFSVESADVVRNSLISDVLKLKENPSYCLDHMVNQSLYYRTGLANPKFGTVTTISRMTSSDSKEFFERVLTPKTTVISVVGNVDADQVFDKVTQTVYKKFVEGGEYRKLKFVSEVDNYVGGAKTRNKRFNQSRMVLSFPSLSYKDSNKYALDIVLPLILKSIRNSLKTATFFHNEKISAAFFANNGKLTIETMVDNEHIDEYLTMLVNAIKELKINKIASQDFEFEKKAYSVNFLLKNESISELSLLAAKEVAINKQSYNETSETMKIQLLKVNDANNAIDRVFNLNKLFIAYLGLPFDIDVQKYIGIEG